ncbi:MAG TPA: hypothetical protein VM261_28195 [Kofleriaceae bacterium]|nr:hypothetical protein [Kofleriaceae bacterium]
MLSVRHVLASVGVALFLSACAGGGSGIPQCDDEIDNDGDGLVDNADPACQAGGTRESDDPPAQCGDGIDNDADGHTDSDDPGCEDADDKDEYDGTGAACMDGVDNDGDGKTDYPDDPGCLAPNQGSGEGDDCPGGPNCPQCGNGTDDDLDGKIDYAGGDTGCISAADRDEFSLDANACGAGTSVSPLPTSGTVSGTINTGTSNTSTTCGGSATIGTGAEVAYIIRIDRPMTLVATLDYPGTNFDSVLYIRRACNEMSTQIACSDDIGGTNTRSALTTSLTAGSYYLIVDGKAPATAGAFTLTANLYAGLGETCTGPQECAPGHVCRVAAGGSGMTCERPVCNDGRDDDGDTKTDFPLDPGCVSPDDMTEQDTCPGTGCPACADGMDNDNDNRTDYPSDTSCTSASGTSEADCPTEVDALQVITAASATGTTAGAGNQFTPACDAGSNAPDRVHMLYVRAPLASLTIDTNDSAFDTSLMLKDSTCGTTDVSCNDDGGTPFGRSRLALTGVGVGSYAVVVDGSGTASGAYNLHVAGSYANGMACDPTMPMFRCNAGYACTGALGTATCQPAACNDTMDADGDGANGYPGDPGCTSISDGDESDTCFPTPGPGCPACANDVDDDMDGLIDYPADTGCTSASGVNEQCITTDPVRNLTTATLTNQSTTTLANDLDLSCGTDGRDEVFRVRVDFPINEIRVDTIGSPLDTVLALKSPSCSAFDLQCDDNTAGNGDSEVFLVSPAVGEYFIIVDDRNVANPSTYNLRVRGNYANGGRCSPTNVFTCNTGYACTGAAGAETCNPAACNDTTDADGDGLPGYPSDPGCTSTSDGDESDTCFPTPGAGCPQCADDVDNDSDGFTDYPMDPACLAAAVNDELAPCTSSDPVLVFSQNVVGHTTNGRLNDVLLSCGANGRDQIYRLFVTQPLVSLTVDTLGSDINTALAVRGATCNGTDLACGVNNFGNMDARVSINTVGVGEYFLVVDDQSTANPTTYNLNVSGTLAAGSTCNPSSTSFICTAGYTCSGGGTCMPTACNDTTDADGDGDVGYPSDAGCTDISDTTEADDCPSGPSCPVCANGLDDDGDTRIDYPLDLGCTAASASSELECMGETDPLSQVTGPVSTGTTTGGTNNFAPTCSSSSAPEKIHLITLPVPVATLTLDTIGSTFDTILELRNSTCGTSLACDDDSAGGLRSLITRTNVAAGTYAISVDGYSSNAGAYTLNVRGTVAVGTACTGPLFTAGVLSCTAGSTCNAGTCQ